MSLNAAQLAAAIVSLTFLFAKHVVGAPSALEERQETNVNGLPAGWNFVGCYDDNNGFRTPATPNGSSNRTLKAQSLLSDTGMTPAVCIEFCSNFPFSYGFAGVELGQQCWCDGVIQLTANLTDSGECNFPCSGDDTVMCGGTKHISIFTDGTPSPKIPTWAFAPLPNDDVSLVASSQYVGCYSDSAANRTLQTKLSNVVGLDAGTCSAACAGAFPNSENFVPTLVVSGVESGDECWCGPSISWAARKLPDIACESMGCLGSNDQACGGVDIIAVYEFNPIQLEVCKATAADFLTPFQLNAVFLDGATASVPITMTSLIVHTNFGQSVTNAGILSHCPTCPSPVTFELDTSSQWELHVIANPDTAVNNLTIIHPGGTVNFVEITDDDKVFAGYCTANSLIHKELSQLTAFGARETPPALGFTFNNVPDPFISFALCSNLTAGGRLDIVYKPITSQPGYNLTDCRDVMLEMNFNVTVPGGTS